LVEVVFPHLTGVVIDEVTADGGVLQIRARPIQAIEACPDCATVSASVHSRYERRIADIPAASEFGDQTASAVERCPLGLEDLGGGSQGRHLGSDITEKLPWKSG
jgi:hypothetical protein